MALGGRWTSCTWSRHETKGRKINDQPRMSFIHVPFCSRYYFMDEKRCISVPRTRSQIGAINTQQVDTDGEYFYSLLRENECFAEMCRKCFISPSCGEDTWHVARVPVFAHSPNNCRECGGRYRQILFLTRLSGICPIYPPLDTRNNIVWCSRLRALVAGQHSPNTAQKIF